MITSRRMAAVDANAAALGVPPSKLMENAGAGLAREIRDRFTEPEVAAVAGTGNNGGDALVAARFLDATTVLLGDRDDVKTDTSRDNLDALLSGDYDVVEVHDSSSLPPDLFDVDVVVDGVLGTGVSGELREPAASAIRRIDESDAYVVSVDVPSGVDPDAPEPEGEHVEADLVVTFHDRKPVHDALDVGVEVVDIGIPGAASRYVGRGDVAQVERDPESHKGDNGVVAVVGGGPYTGAPVLSARASLRAGGDLSYVVTTPRVARVAENVHDLIARPVGGDRLTSDAVEEEISTVEDADAAVVGPGLGGSDEALEAAVRAVEAADCAVVDAEAIAAVTELETRPESTVATPHAGELSKHLGYDAGDTVESRETAVKEAAAEHDVTVLLKGKVDVVSDGERTRLSRTGNAGMTVGGTGDVLAGVTGRLLSAREGFEAASVAAYVNGAAGDVAYEEKAEGLMASDVVEALPYAFDV